MIRIYLFLVLLLISHSSTDRLLAVETWRPRPDRTLVIELTAYGRGGHGASLNPSSAPHRLIRALSRIERSIGSRSHSENSKFGSKCIESFAIQSVSSGEKVNVTPDQASAQILVTLLPGVDIRGLEKELSELVTSQVEFEIVDPAVGKEVTSI